MERHGVERLPAPPDRGHHRLPHVLVRRKALPIVIRPRVVEIGDAGERPEVLLLVRVGGLLEHEIVLEDEVAETVQDRLPFVDLDAADDVRAVAGEDVGAGVDHRMGEGHEEFRRHGAIAGQPFVRVDRDQGVIRHPGGVANHGGNLVHVLLQRRRVDGGRVARDEPVVEEAQLVAAGGRPQPQVAHQPAERLQAVGRELVRRGEAERVQPGARLDRRARAACARMAGERGGDRDERDAAVRRVEELRLARFVQALADAGLDEPRGRDVLRRQPHALDAVVARVVVGARDHVEAGPRQLFRELRVAAHPRAAALVHRVRLVVVQQHLEVGERGVGATDEVHDGAEARTLVDRQGARDDRVAGERQREGAGRRRRRRLAAQADRRADAQDNARRNRAPMPHGSSLRVDARRPGKSDIILLLSTCTARSPAMSRSRSWWPLAVALAAVAPASLHAQAPTPRPMGIVDLIDIPRLADPQLSPDGRDPRLHAVGRRLEGGSPRHAHLAHGGERRAAAPADERRRGRDHAALVARRTDDGVRR